MAQRQIQPVGSVAELCDWLIARGHEGLDREIVLQDYCQHLIGLGVPLLRLHVAQSSFHPKYGSLGFDWLRDEGLTREVYEYSDTLPDVWLNSPLYHLLKSGAPEMRERLSPDTPSRFPLLEELRARGATEYFATAVQLSEPTGTGRVNPDGQPPEGVLLSWTSDAPDGFSEADLDIFRQTLPPLALTLKSTGNRQMAEDLLRVYLGRDAGRRVLSGELQRGSLREIDAVICYFDLNGFTQMAETLPGSDLIAMLNDYFGIAVAEIQNHGGHILKFMGDGLLAMFGHEDMRKAADAALDAAVVLRWCMEGRNCDRRDDSLPTTEATLALHAGRILYGNIGAENRLDFTAIGPAVNLTARLSGMHHSVGQDLILSEEVRRLATPGRHDLVSLGRYMLRGVAEPHELFTIYQAGSPT